MPSSTAPDVPKGAATTNTRKRFELPALDLKLGSLTDGTDIPPPLPSPIQEESDSSPADTTDTEAKEQAETIASKSKPVATSPHSQLSSVSTTGSKRRADDGPLSPTLSHRQGSIRRLFSRGLLNTSYANGHNTGHDGRPESRGSVIDSRKTKRSSGWFGRIRSNESLPLQPPTPRSPPPVLNEKPAGPPPPMIPELGELNSKLGIANDTGFGSDLFKNIK
ncbi:hypothetical protein N0V88_003635 [Collariella sp. IMI 366227]|nr:hypothetical protein N0V88_003635 [Collariella sp. IMI 366227]